MKRILVALSAGVFVCLFYKDSFAAVPPIPTGQSLDAQAERFQEEYSSAKTARDQVIAKALIEAEEEQKNTLVGQAAFVLRGVRLTGTTIFDPQNLSFTWKPYLNKTVTFYDLNNIVKMLKQVYKDFGYLTTTAYLPPQNIADGIVEIRVVEGKRGELTVEGNKYFSTASIEKYFHTYQGEPMDMGGMERDLMRINQDKDLSVTSVLSPGETPETVDVTLKAQETFPYHVSIGTDNQGSLLTGTYRRLVNINTSNLTGNEDSLSFNGAYSDLSQGDYLSYQTPVGTYGTKLGLDAGYFQGKLGYQYKAYDITNYTEFYDPNASFELYSSQNSQVNLRTGMQIKEIHKKQATEEVTDENLRLPYAALDTTRMDNFGQTSFSPQLSFNAPGFLDGSNEDNTLSSRPDVDRFFAKYDQYLDRTQYMPWGSYIQVQSQIQFASRTLPTSEQLQLGGEGSIRGYPEGDFLADNGGFMDTTWYFPMYLIPSTWKMYGTSARNDIQPFIFYDLGGGKEIYTFSGEREEKFLAGEGLGIKIRIKGNFYLKLEWAVPSGDTPIHGAGPSTFDVSFQAGN